MASAPKWKREGFWLEINGAEEAVRRLGNMQASVAREVFNTFGYIGEVLRAMLAEQFPASGGSFPGSTKPGRATGRSRGSIVAKVRGKVGGSGRAAGRVSLVVYPTAKHDGRAYPFMLGYGWQERTITVRGGRVRSRDWRVDRTSIDSAGKFRRRSVLAEKGIGDSYKRRHHLDPHSLAPPIVAGYRGWIDQQIAGAVTRGAREAMNGRGS